MQNNRIWARSEIENLLQSSPKAVEKGIVRLYNLQTLDEQASETTNHHNNVGFAGNAAKKGTYYAKWVLKGRNLTNHHLENARKICIRHAGQLTKVANGEL